MNKEVEFKAQKNNVISDEQVKKISDHLEKFNSDKEIYKEIEENENTESELEVLEGSENLGLDSAINSEFTEEDMRNLGLDEETIESLKDVDVCPEDLAKTEIKDNDYLDAFKEYDIPDNEAMVLLELIQKFRMNDTTIKYYDELPPSVKRMADATRMSCPYKMSKESSATFLIKNFINDAAFARVVDDYTNDMATLMNEMHLDFQNIIHESLDDMMKNIDKIKESNPEQAEKLEKLQNTYKDAISFNKQLEYLDGGISLKKLNKWANRFRDECFYFNKKVSSDANKASGIKFVDIGTLVPTIKNALNGFTELEIQRFIIVFIRSTINMDMNDINNTYYVYSAISSIDSFRFNSTFDTELGKELFENIAKVIRKINSL